ncbi:MAG: EVE domain-containing protein [Gammaproteobacteria bacterium]|nr:EVE domain-containing protein [Gammaproteobacteria bacterium]
MAYWLMKSEPDVFSIDDLANRPQKVEQWDGVRNYQARNFLRDQMKKGDSVLFYHSSCKTPAVVGIAEVIKEGYPDHTASNPESDYYDPKSTPDNPRWYMVDIRYVRHLEKPVTLSQMKANQSLINNELPLIQKGSRLSVMPITKEQWQIILSLE